jgi:hypothetical protein
MKLPKAIITTPIKSGHPFETLHIILYTGIDLFSPVSTSHWIQEKSAMIYLYFQNNFEDPGAALEPF